jgi:hypothetical protein
MGFALLLAASISVVLAMLAVDRRGGSAARRARTITRVSALVAAAGGAVIAWPLLRQDGTSLGFNAVALGVPLVAAAVATLPGRGWAVVAATWLAAAVLVAYVVVFGLGIGLYFAPAALLLLAAAATRSAGTARVR